jgi:hypothetical protein
MRGIILTVAGCIVATILLSSVYGCSDTSPSSPAVAVGTQRVTVPAGSTYHIDLKWEHDDGQVRRDTSSMKLISKVAFIGGRERLLAFESSAQTVTFWDIDASGDLWEFKSFNTSAEALERGFWVRFPTSGIGVSSVVTSDTTFDMGAGERLRYLRTQTSLPDGDQNITVDGRTYLSHKIRTRYDNQVLRNGVKTDESSDYTMTQWFVPELGTIVKSSCSIDKGGDRYTYTYLVTRIER